jgi:hypothetical protein
MVETAGVEAVAGNDAAMNITRSTEKNMRLMI